MFHVVLDTNLFILGGNVKIIVCACLNSANLCILGGNVKVIVCAGS